MVNETTQKLTQQRYFRGHSDLPINTRLAVIVAHAVLSHLIAFARLRELVPSIPEVQRKP